MRRTLTLSILSLLLACGSKDKAAPKPADAPARVTQLVFCGKQISTDDHSVHCTDPAVTDLLELSALRSLHMISLDGTGVRSLHQLRDVGEVVHLDLANTAITDLSSFDAAQWPKLEFLSLSHTAITDLTPLSGLPALKTLQLNNSAVADLTPLAKIATLTDITVANSAVTQLPDLSGATSLEKLDVSGTLVADLSPLRGARRLKELWILYTLVEDVSPLAELPALIDVQASQTAITPASLAELRRRRPDLKIDSEPRWTGSIEELRALTLAREPPGRR